MKPTPTPDVIATYDAGLLNDFGGGDVSWWQDYLRAELERAHEFYASQFAALSVPAAAVVGEPVAWQPRYKQEVIDHHRSQGADFWEYAMTVYPTKEGAEGYGYGGHEARPLYPAPPAPDVMRDALSLVIEYDDLLRHWEGPEQVLLAGDVEEIDAAYDKMVAACRAALGGASHE